MRARRLGWLVCLGLGPTCDGVTRDEEAALEARTVSLREVCTSIADALCGHAAECAPPGVPGCAAALIAGCCPPAIDCDVPVETAAGKDELDAALAALGDAGCGSETTAMLDPVW